METDTNTKALNIVKQSGNPDIYPQIIIAILEEQIVNNKDLIKEIIYNG